MERKVGGGREGGFGGLPAEVLVRQVRTISITLPFGAGVVVVGAAVFVFLVRAGRGIAPGAGEGFLAPVMLAVGLALAGAGWIASRPWRAALAGTRPIPRRRDLAVAARQGLLGLFLGEGGTVAAVLAFLLDGRPAFLAAAILALAFLVFQRTDADRAAELTRGLGEGEGFVPGDGPGR